MTLYDMLSQAESKTDHERTVLERVALAARWLGQEESRGQNEQQIQESSKLCVENLQPSRYRHVQSAAVSAGYGGGHASLNTDAGEIGNWEFDQ